MKYLSICNTVINVFSIHFLSLHIEMWNNKDKRLCSFFIIFQIFGCGISWRRKMNTIYLKYPVTGYEHLQYSIFDRYKDVFKNDLLIEEIQ